MAKSPTVKSGRKRSSNFLFHSHSRATWYRVLVGSRRSEKLLADDVNDCENHLRAKSQDLWHSDTRRAARLIPLTGFCFKNPGDRIRHLALKLSAGGFNRQTLSYLQECSWKSIRTEHTLHRLITIGMLLTISEIWVKVGPGVHSSVLLSWHLNALGHCAQWQ